MLHLHASDGGESFGEGVPVRDAVESRADGAGVVDDEGRRSLQHPVAGGEIGAVREIDLDMPEPVVAGGEVAEQPAHLRASGAHLRAELHQGRAGAEFPDRGIRRIEAKGAAVAALPVAAAQHEADDRREHDECGGDPEGERGGHASRVRGTGTASADVSHRDEASHARDRSAREGNRGGIVAVMSAAVPTPYEDLLRDVLETGTHKSDRTGTGTTSVFGRQIRFDLSKGFPLITTKRVHFKSIAYELLWFLQGDSNVGWLRENGVTIWDEWADESGDLGPVYGVQWRSWPTPDGGSIDQLSDVIEQIRRSPDSRRLIVSAWNPADIPDMALAPCHALFQFYVADGKLSCQLYQRSADMFLGVPFNIASYALLTMMIAQQVGLEPGDFVWTGGDCHVYDNHVDQVREQLSREPYEYPTLRFARKPDSILDYRYEDFVVEDYQHHAPIRAAVAV